MALSILWYFFLELSESLQGFRLKRKRGETKKAEKFQLFRQFLKGNKLQIPSYITRFSN